MNKEINIDLKKKKKNLEEQIQQLRSKHPLTDREQVMFNEMLRELAKINEILN